jgi:hypothetical protein
LLTVRLSVEAYEDASRSVPGQRPPDREDIVVSDNEVSVDLGAPPDVVDLLLWRDAQEMLGRHSGADRYGDCVWCALTWPCPPRRLAERAEAAAFGHWNEAWTARHDLRTSTEHRAPRHAARNTGPFDPPTYQPR